MSIETRALGRQENTAVETLPFSKEQISYISDQLDELEGVGMTPYRIALLQALIQSFSNRVHQWYQVMDAKREILDQTISQTQTNPSTFKEFVKLSKMSQEILHLRDHEHSFVDRMHNHLASQVEAQLDADPSLDQFREIDVPFFLLSSFIKERAITTKNRITALQNAPESRVHSWISTDTRSDADRLIEHSREHDAITQKYLGAFARASQE